MTEAILEYTLTSKSQKGGTGQLEALPHTPLAL